MARGISRSDTLQNVLDNAAAISGKGIKEIVVTADTIGYQGKGELGTKRN